MEETVIPSRSVRQVQFGLVSPTKSSFLFYSMLFSALSFHELQGVGGIETNSTRPSPLPIDSYHFRIMPKTLLHSVELQIQGIGWQICSKCDGLYTLDQSSYSISFP